LISTSPAAPRRSAHPDLPPMSEELRSHFAQPPPQPEWTDRQAVIDYIVEGERPFRGSYPLEEKRLRALAGRIFDRTINMASSMTNHWLIDGDEPATATLGEIAAPTLVIHGTHDPLFPIGHGEVLTNEIRRAHLLPLEGVGHEMPPPAVWDVVIRAILKHTAAAE
jgi:pimeloyl-ACP methyl ester carboxylesterase